MGGEQLGHGGAKEEKGLPSESGESVPMPMENASVSPMLCLHRNYTPVLLDERDFGRPGAFGYTTPPGSGASVYAAGVNAFCSPEVER